MTDNYGKEIKVGSEVIYNMSGMLVKGTVVEVGDRFKVALDLGEAESHLTNYYKTNHISTIRNEASIFVIK